MANPIMVLPFVTAALVLLVLPGPAVAFVVTRSLEQGTRAGVVSQLGLCAGLLVHLIAAIVGISTIIIQSAIALQTLKVLGGLYLVWIGLRTLGGPDPKFSKEEPIPVARDATSSRYRKIFLDGFVLDALNPKPALFFVAVLPQFVDPDFGRIWLQITFFGCLFIGLALATGAVYAVASGAASRHLHQSLRSRRFTKWTCGATYIALGTAAATWRH